MRHILLFFWGALVALALAPAVGRADGTFGDAVEQLAQDIKTYAEAQGKTRLTVGQFPGKGDMGRFSTAGPLIQTALESRLKQIGLQVVDKKGDYEVSGEYSEYEDSQSRQFVLIKAELRDRSNNSVWLEGKQKKNGKQVVEKYYVKNESDLGRMLGLTVQPPANDTKGRIDAYKKAVDDPKVFFNGNRVLAGAGSPFAVEIFTAPRKPGGHQPNEYQAQRPTDKGGLAFVPIQRDYVYAVKLFNDTDYAVAAHVCIDGLTMFHAAEARDPKTGQPKFKFIILPPHSNFLVRGWFINTKATDEFLVTEYAKSEAGKIGHSAGLGTITVTYHAAWDKKTGKKPHDEPENPDEYSHSASDATGRGDRITQNYQVVDYQTGVPRAQISVRYAK